MQRRHSLCFAFDTPNRTGRSLTAIPTDSQSISTTSTPISITVANAATQVYYIHTDQLNTPRLITNQANAKVWEWNNEDPFGNNVPNDDPNNTGNHFVYNPRLPGQYFDSETNTHYNYFRDYDPATGRYIESDPIGLSGGINTYAYVGGNPMSYVDPEGLRGYKNGGEQYSRCVALGNNPASCTQPPPPPPTEGCGCPLRAPDFINFQIDAYVGSVSGSFSRSGNSFVGGGINLGIPNPVQVSASVTAGYLNRCNVTNDQVDSFLSGYGASAAGGYLGLGGGVVYSPGNGTATVGGFGAGVQAGSAYKATGSLGAGYSAKQGQTGLGW